MTQPTFPPIRLSLLTLAAGLVAAAGCTTSMTNLTSARALDPGEHQVTVAGQINFNSAVWSKSAAAVEQVHSEIKNKEEGEKISEETFRKLLDAAVVGALFRPSPTPEGAYRLGITDVPLEGIDLGVRYNGQTLKGDVKLQFWESTNEVWAGSIQAGYGHQFSLGPSLGQRITLQDWSRSDLDLMIPFGASFKQLGRVYLGPRVVWSHISASPNFGSEIREHIPENLKDRADEFFNSEELLYVGGNLGGMIGYRYAYLALEVNVMHVAFKPELVGETRDLSGVSVTPAIGMVFRF